MTEVFARRPRVGLFVTCLVDLMRPSVGFAAVRLLEAAGCEVVVPEGQTCCGQPAYNGGDAENGRKIAMQTMRAFDGFDYVVAPSGSCAAMLKVHYPRLLADDPQTASAARAFAERVHELCAFLIDVCGLEQVPGSFAGRVTYHDGCSGLRELKVREQPRRLLATVPGLELCEMSDTDVCCGFGGLFAMKFPAISNAMVTKKCANAASAKPDLLLSGEMGCLLNVAGKLSRQGAEIECRHIAEVLAGEMTAPAIASSSDGERR
ncbi:(Fe-S)-binding protein [Hyphomicrobium sulfonivorans]|nr:(Fe-S)-binding protein [Hyphomicrobium sulfonivorans]